MNNVCVRKNERSWAIEIISQINSLADNYDLVIKRAGGESTISQKGKNLFIVLKARQILHDKRPQALCKRATARRAALGESQTAQRALRTM